jgi:hypothetical protein
MLILPLTSTFICLGVMNLNLQLTMSFVSLAIIFCVHLSLGKLFIICSRLF